VTGQRRYREGDEIPALARTPDEWRAWAESQGERPFRGTQVFKWLHARQELDPNAMTDVPKATRSLVAEALHPRVPTIERTHQAADRTRKLVVRMGDGAVVETVLIPMTDAADQKAELEEGDDTELDDSPNGSTAPRIRVTQCVSTQAGCAMGCAFCASGVPGLQRHLGPDEIVAQVLLGRAQLHDDERLSNIVLMGMGEPLHNYDATARAVRVLGHDEGMGLSTRRITISTVGLVPELERLGRDFRGRIGLAISLHAADDATRTRLVPVNKRYPLPRLMEALRRYPLPPRRRITIEYALIDGVNDDDGTARRLVALLRGIPVKVNLIPLNTVEHSSLRPSSEQRVLAFQRVLTDAHMSCFIRRRRGDDISAACGQLAGQAIAVG
jgi:23S rRNA (adenine2503-C2)-methyltransferase